MVTSITLMEIQTTWAVLMTSQMETKNKALETGVKSSLSQEGKEIGEIAPMPRMYGRQIKSDELGYMCGRRIF